MIRSKKWPVRPVVATLLMVSLSLPGFGFAANPLFQDGFESGNLSNWTASAGFVVQNQIVFDGMFAGRATSTGAAAYVYESLSAAQSDLNLDVQFYLVSVAGTVVILRFRGTTGKSLVSLQLNRSGKLSLVSNVAGTSRTSATIVSTGVWHEARLHATINGSSSLAEVWLDGTELNDVSGMVNLGTSPIGRVQLGSQGTSKAFDVAFDDAVASATSVADTEAPATPTGLTSTANLPTEAHLTWNPATDNVGVTGYDIYRSDSGGPVTQVGTSTTTSFVDAGLTPTTSYAYTVDAFDAANNHSAQSIPLVVITASQAASPIQHVVIVDLENHTFDDVLGRFCAEQRTGAVVRDGSNQGCDGATQAMLKGQASPYQLTLEPNMGLNINHSPTTQRLAIDGGAMDGWKSIIGCGSNACLAQYDPLVGDCGNGTQTCIPNVTSLAKHYALSDKTFELRQTPSWAGHMVLASASIERFDGTNPTFSSPPAPAGAKAGGGWGCESGKSEPFGDTGTKVPTCVPDISGSLGPLWQSYGYSCLTKACAYYEPTIFDRMDAADVSWKVYGGSSTWNICPTFAECQYGAQASRVVKNSTFLTDAAAGMLPSVSFVIPTNLQSSHQPSPMSGGDDWLGSLVSAVQANPASWASTAIFITWDDCGCFYDHVNPLQFSPNWGVRVPMLIVSPYAKPGFTDSTPATFASLLAFVEHTFSVPPLNPCAGVDSWMANCTDDVQGAGGGTMYDYTDAFDFTATTGTTPMVLTPLTPTQRAWLQAHPNAGEQAT